MRVAFLSVSFLWPFKEKILVHEERKARLNSSKRIKKLICAPAQKTTF